MMKSEKKYRLRYIVVPLIVLAIYMCFAILPSGFILPWDYEIDYFGKKTVAELYSFQTPKEKKVGKEIVERARACMEYTGDEQSAPKTDMLSTYYYFPYYRKPSRTEVEINLVKCVIHGNEGSVWFKYTLETYDGNNEPIHGSADILTRCTITKDESGDWLVTSVSEPP